MLKAHEVKQAVENKLIVVNTDDDQMYRVLRTVKNSPEVLIQKADSTETAFYMHPRYLEWAVTIYQGFDANDDIVASFETREEAEQALRERSVIKRWSSREITRAEHRQIFSRT